MTTKPPPAPTPRLRELRDTLAGMCVENESSIHQHHQWKAGVCQRCGQKAQQPTKL